MLHERFDIDKFRAIFPLPKLRQQAREFVLNRQRERPTAYPDAVALEKHIRLMEPQGEMITGPYHMAVVEQLRAEALEGIDEPARVSTDVFVFARGEPSDPRCTKIGGRPFWPEGWNWPLNDGDRPMLFVAQFCFADSQVDLDSLPGGILAIFADPSHRSSESLQCHWVQDTGCAPVDAKDLPNIGNSLRPLYGVLHRTSDYVTGDQCFGRYRRSYLLTRIEGTKIGGLPRWIQGADELPGKFLCALGSVLPKADSPYPYVNVEAPVGFGEIHGRGHLMWGDVGSVYFFLGEDGVIRWTEQGY